MSKNAALRLLAVGLLLCWCGLFLRTETTEKAWCGSFLPIPPKPAGR